MKRTALVFFGVLLLTPCLQAQTADQQKATLAYVKKLQNKDGGFSPAAGVEKSSLRATSSAIRIHKYLGGELTDKAVCIKFVESCYDKASGGFADTPGGKPEVAVTAVGLMAVVELKMPRDPYETGAVKYLSENAKTFDEIRIAVAGLEAINKKSPQTDMWIESVKKTINKDGTFGKGDGVARDTASAVVSLMRMGVKAENPKALVNQLNEGQRKDGGFGKADVKTSDLESSYRVMRCYHMLKSKPDVKNLTAFVATCRNEDGGYGVAPGEKSSMSATYFAAIIAYWLAEK